MPEEALTSFIILTHIASLRVRHISSGVLQERAQFAPNDPYFSTVGGQPSVPWSDDSPFARQTSVP